MKQIIILVGTIILGCIIFDLMVGPGDDTLRHASGEAMKAMLEAYG
jgi:hypothetical protein